MPVTLIGDLHVADKMDFESDEGRVYMIQAEEVGLSKTMMVSKELYNALPSAEELKRRSLKGNPLRVKMEGQLKTKKALWNPVFLDLIVEDTLQVEGSARPSLKERLGKTEPSQ